MQLRSRGSARIRYVAKSQDVREGWQYEREIESPYAEHARTWLAELEENEWRGETQPETTWFVPLDVTFYAVRTTQ
jgi:hypothetical protein